MGSLRNFLNKNPWLGWAMAAVLLVVSFFLYYRLSGAGDPYSVERLSETVTIRDIETGEEWTINRGMLELGLRQRPDFIDPKEGLPNPKTGKLTGFPVDRDWAETVKRLNRERQEVLDDRSAKPAVQAAPPR